jgi:hypothetical protein
VILELLLGPDFGDAGDREAAGEREIAEHGDSFPGKGLQPLHHTWYRC